MGLGAGGNLYKDRVFEGIEGVSCRFGTRGLLMPEVGILVSVGRMSTRSSTDVEPTNFCFCTFFIANVIGNRYLFRSCLASLAYSVVCKSDFLMPPCLPSFRSEIPHGFGHCLLNGGLSCSPERRKNSCPPNTRDVIRFSNLVFATFCY